MSRESLINHILLQRADIQTLKNRVMLHRDAAIGFALMAVAFAVSNLYFVHHAAL